MSEGEAYTPTYAAANMLDYFPLPYSIYGGRGGGHNKTNTYERLSKTIGLQ